MLHLQVTDATDGTVDLTFDTVADVTSVANLVLGQMSQLGPM